MSENIHMKASGITASNINGIAEVNLIFHLQSSLFHNEMANKGIMRQLHNEMIFLVLHSITICEQTPSLVGIV